MARGWPAFWTTLLALPFLVGGAYLYLYRPEYPTSTGTTPMLFAGFMILMGLYVQFVVAPPPPEMQPGETLHETVSPFQLAAVDRFPFFLAFFVLTVQLRFRTDVPVILPAATMLLALYFLTTGLIEYWKSSLTVHYVTNRRVITDYRFLWLSRVDVPLPQIKGLEQQQTVFESVLGVGNIVLVTGAGGRRPARIEIRNVLDAVQIRRLIASLRFAHDGDVDEPADLDEPDAETDDALRDDVAGPPPGTELREAWLARHDPEHGTVGGPDQPAPAVPSMHVDRSRTYAVDPELNISLVGRGGDDTSEAAAGTLLGEAATTARTVERALDLLPSALGGRLSAAHATASALSSVIDEEESGSDPGALEGFEWIGRTR